MAKKLVEKLYEKQQLVDLRNAISFVLEKNLYGFETIGVGTGYGACDIDFYYKNKNYHIALTKRQNIGKNEQKKTIR